MATLPLRQRGIGTTIEGVLNSAGWYITGKNPLLVTGGQLCSVRYDVDADWDTLPTSFWIQANELFIDWDLTQGDFTFRWDGTNGFNDELTLFKPTGRKRWQIRFDVIQDGGVSKLLFYTRDPDVYDQGIIDDGGNLDDTNWTLVQTIAKAGLFTSSSGNSAPFLMGAVTGGRFNGNALYELYVEVDSDPTDIYHFDGDVLYDYDDAEGSGDWAASDFNGPSSTEGPEEVNYSVINDRVNWVDTGRQILTAGGHTLTGADWGFRQNQLEDDVLILAVGNAASEAAPLITAGAAGWAVEAVFTTSSPASGNNAERLTIYSYVLTSDGDPPDLTFDSTGQDHTSLKVWTLRNVDLVAGPVFNAASARDANGGASTAYSLTELTGAPVQSLILQFVASGIQSTYGTPVNAALSNPPLIDSGIIGAASIEGGVNNSAGHDGSLWLFYGGLPAGGSTGAAGTAVATTGNEYLGITLSIPFVGAPKPTSAEVSWAEFEVPAPSPFTPTPVPRSTKPIYSVVAVARRPKASGAPDFFELGPLVVPTITWVDTLSRETSINLSVANIHRIEQPIKDRLRNLKKTPLEVIVYRGSEIMARGTATARQVQGETLTLTASGLLYYLRYMGITQDFSFASAGQFGIVRDLVDGWQNLSYGDFGIDTSDLGAAGTARDRTYLARENQNVYTAVQALSTAVNGFDMDVDLETRKLKLFQPTKGVDRSADIILDSRNIVNPNVFASVAAGTVATDVQATGVSIDIESTPVVASRSDTVGWQEFGRAFLGATFDNVSSAGTLEDYAAFLLGERSDQLFTPGPELFPIAEVGVTDFDTGDLVAYNFDTGLGYESGKWRVLSKSVRVDAGGNEQMRVKFTADYDPEDFS